MRDACGHVAATAAVRQALVKKALVKNWLLPTPLSMSRRSARLARRGTKEGGGGEAANAEMPGCQAVAASQSGEHDDEHIASSQDSARCDAGRFRSLENLAKALRIRLQKELAEKVATVQEAAIARADAAIALQHLSSIEDDYFYANLERARLANENETLKRTLKDVQESHRAAESTAMYGKVAILEMRLAASERREREAAARERAREREAAEPRTPAGRALRSQRRASRSCAACP